MYLVGIFDTATLAQNYRFLSSVIHFVVMIAAAAAVAQTR
jgi:hypothetical protein